MDLTPDQAQALFDAGGFIIITDLPAGSEFGIDGVYHTTRRFSGIKFLPPGLHLVTWSSLSSSSPSTDPTFSIAGPSSIPLRHALIRITLPRQRLILHYAPHLEDVRLLTSYSGGDGEGEDEVMSDGHLRTLDPELAAYPFEGLGGWKDLTGYVTQEALDDVIGVQGRVDGMKVVQGEEEDKEELLPEHRALEKRGVDTGAGDGDQRAMKFVAFRLKKSWRDGAVGEELSRYAVDKSWLFGHIVNTQLRGDPLILLAQLQLSFIFLLNLSSYSCLLVYKRLLPLFTRSSRLLVSPTTYLAPFTTSPTSSNSTTNSIQTLYISFIQVLSAQLRALPQDAFDSELPEMDLFFVDEIESLRINLATLLVESSHAKFETAWKGLQSAGQRWSWIIQDLDAVVDSDEEEEDELGEYAPVIVDT